MPAGKTHTEDRFEAAIEADLLELGGYVADDTPYGGSMHIAAIPAT